MTKSLWDACLAAVNEQYETIDQEEKYKFDLAAALAKARTALLHDEPDWPDLATAAVRHKHNNLIHWMNQEKVVGCIASHPNEMRDALREMWSEDDRTPGDRIRAFDDRLSESMLDIPPSAVGSRLAIASYFMMGLDAQRYPPYQTKRFQSTYKQLDYPQSSAEDAGGRYEHALGFLDRMLEEARRRDMDKPATRMDAQSVVFWQLHNEQPNGKVKPEPPTPQVEPAPNPHPLNTILYGPPGTGKTWHTVTRAVAIVENRNVDEVELENRNTVKSRFDKHQRGKRIEMVTFHQNTTYEDFVEGIRPVLTSSEQDSKKTSPERSDPGDIRYEMSRGVFRRIAERAEKDRNRPYVLVIDEINRGNIARIFGELITLVEDSKRIGKPDEARVTLPGSKTDFGVPSNLYLLGTMNTADRSIALLDTALRRRFAFIEMMPDPSHDGVNKDIEGVDCGKVLDAMNRRIAVLLDREHQIGHTYFLGVASVATLAKTFRRHIMPLLQEYFYDDWGKIRAVLNNNGFVVSRDLPDELVRQDLTESTRRIYDLLPADHKKWTDPKAYRDIYETAAAETDDDSESQRD